MNKRIRHFSWLLVVLTVLSISGESMASGWQRFVPFVGSRDKDVLIVTGNYAKPRLLAEVAQLRGKATILIITQTDDGDQLYFMENYPDARLIPNDRLVEFLAVLSPTRVIILGDESYVPARYTRIIRSRYPLLMVTGDDWIKNAKSVAATLNDRRLLDEYRHYLAQLIDEQIKRSEHTEDIPMRDRVIVP